MIRQSKETLGQRRIDLETAARQAQQAVVQAWGQLEAAKAQINATQAQVTAAEIALNGVREEARVGQRTTLDVLNAQQELVNARVALVTAQRDRVVASYSLLSAVGPAVGRYARPEGAGLRSDRALPAGARQLDRRADAGRALTAPRARGRRRVSPDRRYDVTGRLRARATKWWTGVGRNGAARLPCASTCHSRVCQGL